MTDKKPDNPQAFPFQYVNSPGSECPEGMTLLDWYAGKALAGYFAHDQSDDSSKNVAVLVYDMAEAMLAERQKRMERES